MQPPSSQHSRILVTGGAGFIGRNLVHRLSSAGHQVAILDNFSVATREQIASLDAEVYEADIRDERAVADALGKFAPQTVFHLAAVHHIPTCENLRAHSLDVNVRGTEVLLGAAEEAGVAAFVLASSGAVYNWTDGPLDEDNTPLGASDNYSLAKLANESQLRFWSERTGGWARVARIFNTIGPDDPNGHLVPDVLHQLDDNASTIRLGNLTPRRDYIYVTDTAEALASLLLDRRHDVRFDVFNVASGSERSVEEFVRMIAAQLGIAPMIEVDERRRRRVDRPSQLGAVDKIQRVVGWSVAVSLELAVGNIVAARSRPGT